MNLKNVVNPIYLDYNMSFKLKSLELENFVVYKNRSKIDFADAVNLIEGSHINNPLQSNGAGKSLLLDAISLALFGKGIRASYITDYILNKNDGIYIGLELEQANPKSVLKIERWRRPNSTLNKAKVWLNSVCISDDMTISKIDELVYSYIGINYNNFLSCIFSVMIPGFLKLRPAQRFEILEQALAIKKMDSVIKKVTNSIKDTQDKLDSTSKLLNEKFNLLQTEKAKQELYTANSLQLKQSLTGYESEYSECVSIETDLIKLTNSLTEKLSDLKVQITPKIELIRDLTNKNSILTANKLKLSAKMKETLNNLKSLNNTIECEICKSHLTPESKEAIKSHFISEIELINTEIDKNISEVSVIQAEVDSLTELQSSYNTKFNLVSKKLKTAQTNLLSLERNISSIKDSIRLSNQSFDKKKLKGFLQEVTELNSLKKELTKSLSIDLAWKQALSKNGLRLAYIKEEIHTLSALASRFATTIYNYPTQINFNIIEEQEVPTLEFTVNGRTGMFSTGEARRLEIAMTLSLLALLNSAGLNLNFLLVDEPIDGLSEPSKEAVKKILFSLSNEYQLVIISHDPAMSKLPGHVIKIEYDNITKSSVPLIFDRT